MLSKHFFKLTTKTPRSFILSNLNVTKSLQISSRPFFHSAIYNNKIDSPLTISNRHITNTANETYDHSEKRQQFSTKSVVALLTSGLIGFYLLYNPVYCHASESEEHKAEQKPWNGVTFRLFKYYGCPFCSKLCAYLRYHQIPYTICEVAPLPFVDKPEFDKAAKKYNYKKNPLLLATDTKTGEEICLKDSSRAISILESFRIHKTKEFAHLKFLSDECYSEVKPGDKKTTFNNVRNIMYDGSNEAIPSDEDILNQIKWRTWVEDKLLHVMATNIYLTHSDSITNMKHYREISPKFKDDWRLGLTLIYVGGAAMKGIGYLKKRKYKLDNPRECLYKYCDEFATNLPTSKENPDKILLFSGNDHTPSVVDLEVFGILTITEGTLVFDDMIKNSKIGPWYFKMRELLMSKIENKKNLDCFIAE